MAAIAMDIADELSGTTETAIDKSVIMPSLPLSKKTTYFLLTWTFKSYFASLLFTERLFSRVPKPERRTFTKSYSNHPKLVHRFFLPPSAYTQPKKKFPLYIDIHGGGFVVGDPETDDPFCSFLARNYEIIVISLAYPKSPRSRFPGALNAIREAYQAMCNDSDLNQIDTSRIAIGGFSAGANLAFALSQHEGFRDVFSAVVGFYPVLDYSEPVKTKLERQRDMPKRDVIGRSASFLNWAYVSAGEERTNDLLSPIYGDPGNFPKRAFLIGAEYDMLYHEAQRMAVMLAKRSLETETIDLTEDEWTHGGVRWELAKKRQHAFTHMPTYGKKEKERKEFVEGLYHRVGKWLCKDVWDRTD
jgi:acetyl esterase/lipase